MNIDSMTHDRDDYRSRDEEYRDWCEEYGLDPDDEDSRDLYVEADFDSTGSKKGPTPER